MNFRRNVFPLSFQVTRKVSNQSARLEPDETFHAAFSYFTRTIKSSCQKIQSRLLVLTVKVLVPKAGVRLPFDFKWNISGLLG